jgi:ATP synthase protein I
MSDKPPDTTSRGKPPSLAEQVDTKAARKLKAQRHVTRTVWFGLGMMGLIGWSVTIPTLLGAALGMWLDRHYPAPHSWTLALLFVGLVIGCVNAWRWITKEDRAIGSEQEHGDE